MSRSRWIIYLKDGGRVVGVVYGEAPGSSDHKGVMEHPTAEIGKHKIDPETLEVSDYIHVPSEQEIRNEFKETRKNSLASSTVEFEGMVFDSDETSQNRMLRPISLLQNDTDTQVWVLNDNTVVNLTRPQFLGVLLLAGEQQTNMWVQP
jgi:hypothetical protein